MDIYYNQERAAKGAAHHIYYLKPNLFFIYYEEFKGWRVFTGNVDRYDLSRFKQIDTYESMPKYEELIDEIFSGKIR